MEQDERILLNRAIALDEDALAHIHDQYYDKIYRYISFRVNDLQTVEDLSSDVFIRFLTTIRTPSAPQNSLRGWLFGTANNVVKEYYRRNKREQWTELNEQISTSGKSPDEEVDVALLKGQLQQAVVDLTEEQQRVLALRFGLAMPVAEVAETMNKSIGSIKMLQARAIAGLTRRLKKQEVGA